MDFTLTETDLALQRTVREFAQRELVPGAQERDAREEFSPELFRRLGALGLTALGISREAAWFRRASRWRSWRGKTPAPAYGSW